jgi:integrase
MGMRISEILKLREEEIDWARSEIKLDPKRLKTRRARKIGIPIPDGIRMRLEAICAEYDSDYVFPMIEKHSVKLDKPQATNDYWWTLARQETGVKCRFHDLRHSYLSNAVKAGIPLDFISKVAGATPQVISGIYSHMEESDKNTFRDLSNSLFNKK